MAERLDELFYDLRLKSKDFERAAKRVKKTTDDLKNSGGAAEDAVDRLGKGSKRAGKGLKDAEKEGSKLDKTLGRLGKRVLAVAAAFLGFRAISRVLRTVTGDTVAFDTAMGQVATLTTLSGRGFELLTDRVHRLSTVVPKNPADLGMGLYQTLSSGVQDAGDAMVVLTEASKLASSGLLDTQTSVDAITTVLNAYGMEASRVSEVTDSFFQTVKEGKVEIPELASEIGKVASSAALAGVSIDEVGAALATMTKLGIAAPEAATALNRFLMTIVQPTDDVVEGARRMGIEWSVAALQAKGLSGFMAELVDATDGNIQALSDLNPNIRAFRAAAVLGGTGAEEFTRILGTMEDKAGAASEAFRETNARMGAQATIIKQRLKNALIDLAEVALPPLISALERLTRVLETPFDRRIRMLERLGFDPEFVAGLVRRQTITETEQALAQARADRDRLESEARFTGEGALDAAASARIGTPVQTRAARIAAIRENVAALRRELEPLQRELAVLEDGRELQIRTGRREGPETFDEGLRDRQARARAVEEQIQLQTELAAKLEDERDLENQIAALRAGRSGTGTPPPPEAGGAAGGQPSEDLQKRIDQARARLEAQLQVFRAEREFLQGAELTEEADVSATGIGQKLREIVALEREIAQAEADSRLLGGGPQDVPEFLDALRRQLARLKEEAAGMREFFGPFEDMMMGRMPGVVDTGLMVPGSDGMRDLNGLLRETREITNQISDAEDRLAMARLQNDPVAIADAERRLLRVRRGLRDQVAGIAQALERSTLPAKEINRLMGELREILSASGIDVDEVEEGFDNIALTVETLGRAILSVADATGAISQEARQALTGVLDLVNAYQQLQDALDTGSALGQIAAGAGIVGAGIGILSAIGSALGSSPAEQEHARLIKENSEALKDLRAGLVDLHSVLSGTKGGLIAAGITGIENVLGGLVEGGEFPVFRGTPRTDLAEELRRLGFTMAELEALAASLDIELDGTAGSYRQLLEALKEIDLEGFFDSFRGQMELLRIEMELFDVDDPIAKLERLRGVLLNLGALPADLQAQIMGLDLSTAEGRAQLEALLQALFMQFQSGALPAGALGDLTPEEFLELISSMEGLVDTIEGQSGESQSFSRNVQITEASAGRLLAMQATQVTRLEQMLELARERNTMLGALSGIEPLAAGVAPSAAGGVTIGTISISVPVGTIDTRGADPEQVGTRIGESAASAMDRALRDRRVRAARSLGIPE